MDPPLKQDEQKSPQLMMSELSDAYIWLYTFYIQNRFIGGEGDFLLVGTSQNIQFFHTTKAKIALLEGFEKPSNKF